MRNKSNLTGKGMSLNLAIDKDLQYQEKNLEALDQCMKLPVLVGELTGDQHKKAFDALKNKGQIHLTIRDLFNEMFPGKPQQTSESGVKTKHEPFLGEISIPSDPASVSKEKDQWIRGLIEKLFKEKIEGKEPPDGLNLVAVSVNDQWLIDLKKFLFEHIPKNSETKGEGQPSALHTTSVSKARCNLINNLIEIFFKKATDSVSKAKREWVNGLIKSFVKRVSNMETTFVENLVEKNFSQESQAVKNALKHLYRSNISTETLLGDESNTHKNRIKTLTNFMQNSIKDNNTDESNKLEALQCEDPNDPNQERITDEKITKTLKWQTELTKNLSTCKQHKAEHELKLTSVRDKIKNEKDTAHKSQLRDEEAKILDVIKKLEDRIERISKTLKTLTACLQSPLSNQEKNLPENAEIIFRILKKHCDSTGYVQNRLITIQEVFEERTAIHKEDEKRKKELEQQELIDEAQQETTHRGTENLKKTEKRAAQAQAKKQRKQQSSSNNQPLEKVPEKHRELPGKSLQEFYSKAATSAEDGKFKKVERSAPRSEKVFSSDAYMADLFGLRKPNDVETFDRVEEFNNLTDPTEIKGLRRKGQQPYKEMKDPELIIQGIRHCTKAVIPLLRSKNFLERYALPTQQGCLLNISLKCEGVLKKERTLASIGFNRNPDNSHKLGLYHFFIHPEEEISPEKEYILAFLFRDAAPETTNTPKKTTQEGDDDESLKTLPLVFTAVPYAKNKYPIIQTSYQVLGKTCELEFYPVL